METSFKKQYKIGPELGRGGFGTVYSGFRVSDGLPIAVKFVARENIASWSTVSKGEYLSCLVCLRVRKCWPPEGGLV